MRAILLPVKDLRNAKQRLSGLLSAEERFGLARAMLMDTISLLRTVKKPEKIFVATNCDVAVREARNSGFEVLMEGQQESESASVDAASRRCAQQEVTALLRLPLDIPLARACDVDDLFSVLCTAPTAVLVPSRDGTGTNAILRSPPGLFPSHFGHGSFQKHCTEASEVGARLIVCRNTRLEMDVDDPSDLVELMRHDLGGTETGRWLGEHNLHRRLQGSAVTAGISEERQKRGLRSNHGGCSSQVRQSPWRAKKVDLDSGAE